MKAPIRLTARRQGKSTAQATLAEAYLDAGFTVLEVTPTRSVLKKRRGHLTSIELLKVRK